jgi:hypothetical protein
MSVLESSRPRAEHTSSPAQRVKTAVADAMRDVCRERYGARLRAVVVTGSLARDEATLVDGPSTTRVLGDAEFLAVFEDGATIPAESELRALEADVTARLAPSIECPISVGGVGTGYLRRLRPHIFGYELRTCGQVIHGDPAVLELIPRFDAHDLPREDAWRLVCNRMIEYLEVAAEAVPLGPSPMPEIRYRTVKLTLDLATSWLVFVGAYRPTYRERAATVRAFADGKTIDAPFDARAFATDVETCTAFKLDGASELDGFRDLSARILGNARDLWRWELSRLANVAAPATDEVLLAAFARRQPRHMRLRGWAVVARQATRSPQTRRWTRWAQVLGPSPRLRVYGVAAALMFALGDMRAEPSVSAVALRRWQHTLPVAPVAMAATARSDWRHLAADVVWNYRAFLVGTQA